MTARNKSNEINITRFYDAELSDVWDAWTDPAQVAQWWGPRGFTLTTHSKDLRPGGSWIYTMHGPDGTDYPNSTYYHEVELHKKLVYDHGANDDRPPLFRVTVLFSEVGGKTKMEMTMALPTPEAAEETRKFIKQAGGNSTWDRLAEYLEKETSDKEIFVINRSFDAPLDLMFEMWTQPEHFSRWLPPTGFEMKFIEASITPGGTSTYSMSNGQGMTMYGRVTYLEIRRPDRIVYTQQFIDVDGNISRHPALATWPETMLTVVQLAAEGSDQTRVTVTWEPYGTVTPEELAAFVQLRSGMTLGWTGSFDKLEEFLASK
ncbi:SRPBCC domain-containing protein [bacterium]|nr:SRPBCC domain-containing protein [bacterium]